MFLVSGNLVLFFTLHLWVKQPKVRPGVLDARIQKNTSIYRCFINLLENNDACVREIVHSPKKKEHSRIRHGRIYYGDIQPSMCKRIWNSLEFCIRSTQNEKTNLLFSMKEDTTKRSLGKNIFFFAKAKVKLINFVSLPTVPVSFGLVRCFVCCHNVSQRKKW